MENPLENHRKKCRLCFKYISKPWNSIDINENIADIFLALTNLKVKFVFHFDGLFKTNDFLILAFKDIKIFFDCMQAMLQ